MRLWTGLLVGTALWVSASTAGARVVLIGIDGGAWPLVDRGIERGDLVHLAALAERGVTAELSTVEPVISPTVWTSIATGRSPAAHGVGDFFRNRTHTQVPTIFERLAARGLRVGLHEYLVTWPPRSLPGGFMIPGWLRRSETVAPSDVFERAGLATYLYDVDGLRSPEEFVEETRKELRKKPGHFVGLLQAFDLDVGAVTFYAADATGHRFWRHAFPEEFENPSEPDPRFRTVIPDTLRGLDRAVGTIQGALTPEDTVLIVSDHGFQAREEVGRVWTTHLDVHFAEHDLDPTRDGFQVDGDFFALTLRVLPGPFAKREAILGKLVSLFESAQTEDGTPLFRVEVVDVAERPAEARRSILTRLRQWGVRMFLARIFGVRLDRPAHAYLFAQPHDEALFAVWPDGPIQIGGKRVATNVLFSYDEFSGTHTPTGIFLAAGGPIRPVRGRGQLSVLDIAPLLAYLSGAPVPDDLEGRVPVEWIDPVHLDAHPVEHVPASELPGLPPEAPSEEADDEVLRERLRALGYL